ncbi:hypothetical protein ABZ584_24485 [Streptomyces antibioticus]|uniref:hypothetical protein n=1 Tax=Streptomyces antibioticus TaxID=1890 RepID=UPI0033D46F4D
MNPHSEIRPGVASEKEHPRAHLIRNPRSQLWLTAVHEAGHAVVCLATGGTFRHATLRKSYLGMSRGHVDMLRCPSPQLNAVVSAAGYAAERMADTPGIKAQDTAMRKAPKGTLVLHRAYSTAKRDLDYVSEVAEQHDLDVGRVLASANAAVHVLYPLIEVAAVALMEPKPLRALSDLDVVMALSMRPGPWLMAAERLLEEQEVYGNVDGWLVRYVKDHLGVA